MTTTEYMIWFTATAVMTVAVLAVGTLAAADLLPGRGRSAAPPAEEEKERRGRR